jgi:hypothetical protein
LGWKEGSLLFVGGKKGSLLIVGREKGPFFFLVRCRNVAISKL